MNIKMGKNKKIIIFSIFSNTLLFITVLLSIQNSNTSRRIKFLAIETIPLPISFIISSSFIIGSISSIFINLAPEKKKD